MPNVGGYGSSNLPDPREVLQKLRRNLRWLVYIAIAAVAVVFFANAYFTVEADENAIVLRLGKPTGQIHEPGLHFKVPIIDQVFKANVKRRYQLEFGFRTIQSGVQSLTDETTRAEALMLTGDLELVNVQWTVLYRIGNLQDYLFNVRDVEETVRDISEAQVRLLVGDRSNDEVMTIRREELAQLSKERIQASLDLCKSGLVVTSIALKQAEPPPKAQEAFNRVNEARAKKQQRIEQAKREVEEQVTPMRGRALAIVAEARGAAEKSVMEAEGEADRFSQVLVEYRKAPDISMRWLYLQSMLRVWSAAGRKLIIDSPAGGGNDGLVKLLPLTDFGIAPATKAPAALPAAQPSDVPTQPPPAAAPEVAPAPAENR